MPNRYGVVSEQPRTHVSGSVSTGLTDPLEAIARTILDVNATVSTEAIITRRSINRIADSLEAIAYQGRRIPDRLDIAAYILFGAFIAAGFIFIGIETLTR